MHLVDGRLRRVSRDGVVGDPAGVLEDHADVAEGLLALLSVTGDPRWLTAAGQLLDSVLEHFADSTGGFYDTADDRADAALSAMRRPQDPTDNATPAGWSAAAGALLTYAAVTGSERHRNAAERALGVYSGLARHARFAGWGLAVAEALLDGPREVAVLGPAADPATEMLHRSALMGTAPGAAVVAGRPAGTYRPGGAAARGPAAAGRPPDGVRLPALRVHRADHRRRGAGRVPSLADDELPPPVPRRRRSAEGEQDLRSGVIV